MKGYRFNAQRTFLTYSQTKKLMTPNKLLELVRQRAGIQDYMIAQEKHKDGGFHLHAYFKFQEKLDRSASKLFLWEYYRKKYMPNVQKIRSVHKVWKYIKKDGKFITNLDETRPVWLVNIQDSETTVEFLEKTMWDLNRYDNYAGYRTYRDLWDLKMAGPRKSIIFPKNGAAKKHQYNSSGKKETKYFPVAATPRDC